MSAVIYDIVPRIEAKRKTRQMAKLILNIDDWMALYKPPMAVLISTPTEQGLYAIGLKKVNDV